MLNKTLSVLLGMLLLIVGSATYAALPPSISWTPAQLAPASLAPGTSANYTVVLKHTGILPIPATNQLRIIAEGASAPFITITQPKFPPVLKRGNQVTVPITISIPANTPAGEIKGSLVLKRILPNGKVNEVWRADVLPAELTFSSIQLPPDPGKAGKATIQGIDSDNDGVRDDIQRYIALTYPTSTKTRAALTQGVVNQQQALLYADDKEHSIQIAGEGTRDTECIHYVAPDDASDIGAALQAVLLNTDARSRAYLAYDRQLSGQVFHMRRLNEWKTSCSFNVDSMED